ncbi:hypothetical protein BH10PSE1_BH10PSE1_01860 [soil metagenome]
MLKSKLFTSGLMAAGLALAACTPSDAAKSPQPGPAVEVAQAPVPGTYTETDQPITEPTLSSCIVVLGLLEVAIKEGRAPGDAAALEAAGVEYRAKLKAVMPNDDEANQMVGSSVAFFDELTVEQLKASVDLCLAAKDRTFTAEQV